MPGQNAEQPTLFEMTEKERRVEAPSAVLELSAQSLVILG